MTNIQKSSNPFLSIPSTPFLLAICPFLCPLDLLNLRVTCRRTYELLHEEHESEGFWKYMLEQNFRIEKDFKMTLDIVPISENIMSIFGVHPTQNAIKLARSNFESWKHWIKCTIRFLSNGETTSSCRLGDIPPNRFLNGPFFLRAATFWSKILNWLETPELSGAIGPRIKASLSRGMYHLGWSDVRDERGLQACQAVYAFCGGPEAFRIMTAENFGRVFDGLLGGYQAYNYYSCTHLIRPRALPSDSLIIATDALSMSSGVRKMFCVNCNTGMVELHYGQNEVRPAITKQVLGERTSAFEWDAVLVWLEEYADRLTSGKIGVGPMGSTPQDQQAVLLYPRVPKGVSPRPGDVVSRTVTRGVEVVASSVYTPQTGQSHIGFIYNFRIRLLCPDDEGYVSAADRGFETCQLRSRHWRILNEDTGHTDQVDGDGVIGMYPLLREGGYTEAGEDFEGTLSYTSCTAPMRGSFAGHMRFVPGSLSSPTGPAFNVEVKPFALDNNPDFLY